MPWTSNTSYILEAAKNLFMLYVIMGKAMAGKTWLIHQLIMAFGRDNVVVADTEGLLDAIAPYNPIVEPMRNRKEAGVLLQKLQAADPKDLPMWFVLDNGSPYGDTIITEANRMDWHGVGRNEMEVERDINIKKYAWIAERQEVVLTALRTLPMNVIINYTSKMMKVKDVQDRERVTELPILPGAKFTDNLARRVSAFLSLRRHTEDGKVRLEFSTEGPWYTPTGERSGKLNAVEPANIPRIHEILTGVAPTYPVECDADGTMRRVEG